MHSLDDFHKLLYIYLDIIIHKYGNIIIERAKFLLELEFGLLVDLKDISYIFHPNIDILEEDINQQVKNLGITYG